MIAPRHVSIPPDPDSHTNAINVRKVPRKSAPAYYGRDFKSVRIFEAAMPNFAPWYRREDYALMREIMEDRDTLPLNFDEWEKEAESQRATKKQEGVNLEPVFVSPEEFLAFCNERHISCNSANCAQFANSRGAASHSMGL